MTLKVFYDTINTTPKNQISRSQGELLPTFTITSISTTITTTIRMHTGETELEHKSLHSLFLGEK